MSLTTKVTGLAIKSSESIINAVEQLKKDGVNIELLENAVPSMFYAKQEKDVGVCDYVLKLGGSLYGKSLDVGFKLQDNGDYEIIFDDFGDIIKDQIGLSETDSSWDKEEKMLSNIAKFTTAYNIDLMTREYHNKSIFEVSVLDVKGGGKQIQGEVSVFK